MLKESTHFLSDANQSGITLSSIIEPLFLCRWNGSHSIDNIYFNGHSSFEIVEIHSKETLTDSYATTNLFDDTNLSNWIEFISQDNDFYNRPYINDNFEIERIK